MIFVLHSFRVCLPFIVRGLLPIRRYLPVLTFVGSVRLSLG